MSSMLLCELLRASFQFLIGIPEEQAHHYQKELEAGRTVVTVMAQSGYAEALDIFRRNGASGVTTRWSEFNASPSMRP